MLQAAVRPYDVWHLGYFEKRIGSYYGENAKLALLALDELAPESALTFSDWWNRVSIQTTDLDKDVSKNCKDSEHLLLLTMSVSL
jgi:hypothetical protein